MFEGLRTRLMTPDLIATFCEEYVAETNRLRGNESARAER